MFPSVGCLNLWKMKKWYIVSNLMIKRTKTISLLVSFCCVKFMYYMKKNLVIKFIFKTLVDSLSF